MSSPHLFLPDRPRRGLWILAILTVPVYFAAVKGKSAWGLENEALIVRCPKKGGSRYPVDWYYSKTNESIPTQKRNRVFASGEQLKFLPAEVGDSGIYTCVVRSPTWNKTGYTNVTIYKRPTDCHIPDSLMYSTVSGSEKNSRIYCPTINLYNWTAPLEWFKNCKVLQGSRYQIHRSFLFIDNAGRDDEGDYTCKFTHTENGVSYSVTATRSFTVKDKPGVSVFPVIVTPSHNETKEVEIGETANITCSACFGRGAQSFTAVLWQVNQNNVKDLGVARIQEEHGQNQSSSDDLACLNTVLRITRVKEEDLLREYNCLARNLHGVIKHAVRLTRKKPSAIHTPAFWSVYFFILLLFLLLYFLFFLLLPGLFFNLRLLPQPPLPAAGSPGRTHDLPKTQTVDRRSIYYVAAGCSLLLTLINVLVILLKVFWIDLILLWREIARPHKMRNDGKLYDAYVVYPRDHMCGAKGASSVEYFVHQILPDVLEKKCGYNLCIYGRDLLPGQDVATAVEASIQKSRRHLFILTPHMSHSKEFAYEQEVALHCALIQNDSKVILIEMEAEGEPGRLQAAGLQGSLSHLVQAQGTIKWRENHVANKRSLNSKFWKHVRYQMPVPSTPRKEAAGEAS